ncbi:MAG: peptide ABC transporter substrate-binding protein [Patescibacteria group bacterium]|jgi:peptide/nickel transport system substrate-binding protein
MSEAFDRAHAWVRRILFWLTPSAKTSSEQNPKTAEDHALVLSVTRPQSVPHWRQLRYATRVLSLFERRILMGALFLFFIFILTGFSLLTANHLISVPADGGTYTEAIIGEPQAINPIDAPANATDADLSSLIYSGLFRMQGMEAIPDLAGSYEWSDDGKTLTVHLQPEAKFHNGKPVTSADVAFTIESIQDTARGSLLAPLFRGVNVAAQDDRTVQFVLDQADATFPIALTVGILPAELWQDIPPTSARLANINLKPVGSGQYFVKSFTRDSYGIIRSYTLESFDRYYGIKPHIQNLTFQFYPDRQSAEDALKSDLVDAVSFIPSDEAGKFGSTARWNTEKLEIPQQTIAFFNLKDKTLTDAKVRQALNIGTNRQDLLAAYNNLASVAEMPFPFLQPTTSTPYDLDAARKLLQDAGWVVPSNDSVRIYQKPDPKKTLPAPVSTASSTKLTFTIFTPDDPALLQVSDALKRQWSLLGAQVDTKPMNAKDLLKVSSQDRNGQIVLWNILLQPDQDLFPIWWSGQAGNRGMNFSGLADKEVDTLIERTKSATSTQALTKARGDLSQAILKQSAALFLVRPFYAYVISNRIKGIPDTLQLAQPSNRFQNIGQWYIKTGLRWK